MDCLDAEFLVPHKRLPVSLVDKLQPRISLNVSNLSDKIATMPSYQPRQRLQLMRTGLEGHIEDIELVPIQLKQLKGSGSMSMTRRMVSTKNNVRGRTGQIPFTPGGLDIKEEVSIQELHHDGQGLLDIAPGLSRAPNFTYQSHEPSNKLVGNGFSPVDGNTADTIGFDLAASEEDDASYYSSDCESSLSTEVDSLPENEPSIDRGNKNLPIEQLMPSQYNTIDSLLPDTTSFVRNIAVPSVKMSEKRTWAHMVDINKKLDNFNELVPHPARTWPFELDTFQKEAVYRLEQGDSVFIAAHTSAGKTVVAEYAMSMAAQHMTKCIYTSPIKALSNQKYRDFKSEYDVGILTGDVQLNPEASTLIMTTEILRSMLYRGADVIRDVEFIIFDEVHYVNDSERGVVWEEVIIMLPDHVKLVLLSATVPNTFEFANWVGRTKEKDVYVISTPQRPVPLRHHLWLKNELFEVVNEKRDFVQSKYKQAGALVHTKATSSNKKGSNNRESNGNGLSIHASSNSNPNGREGHGDKKKREKALDRNAGKPPGKYKNGPASKQDLLGLVRYLKTMKLMPTVMFVFSRKMCEQYAEYMQSVSLNTSEEKSEVHKFINKAVQRLRMEDRELPQIQLLCTMLQKGIGVHHSGLLPIMKEVVEILFAKGLVKMLFATETFAMGLNLPTRTVVFTSVCKFDSKTMRYLTAGEYTQMAGRAGRRGLDTVGTVIIMNNCKDNIIPRDTVEEMVLGKPMKLSSQFKLTYNMILSLLRIEALKVEDVIHQSFSENSNATTNPRLQQRLLKIEHESKRVNEEITNIYSPGMIDLGESMKIYFNSEHNYALLTKKIYEFVISSKLIGHFIVHTPKPNKKHKSNRSKPVLGFIYAVNRDEKIFKCVDFATLSLPVLDQLPSFLDAFSVNVKNPIILPTSTCTLSKISISDVVHISNQKHKHPRDIDIHKLSRKTSSKLIDVFKANRNIWEEYDLEWIKSMEIRATKRDRDAARNELQLVGSSLSTALEEHRLNENSRNSQNIQNVLGLMDKEIRLYRLDAEAQNIKLNSGTSTDLLPEYGQRIDLLRSANYIDDNMIVALKGRVACEISTGYELYVTELIMDNFLGTFEPEEIVALLSVFVFEGARGAEGPPTVTPRLDSGKERLLELVEYVQKLASKYQVSLTQEEADFAENNRFALMHVVYEWAKGMTFKEITQLTTVQEGHIVRIINRLDEVCRSVMSAARIIGEVDLYDKLAVAQELIKRDIVFCSSLYL